MVKKKRIITNQKLEKDSSFYDRLYRTGGHNQQYNKPPDATHYYDIWMAVLKLIDKKEYIIDFGCGVGQFAELALKNGHNYKLGLDFSEIAIDKARERNNGYIPQFFIGNLYDGAIWDKINETFYNVAVFCEVLEHLYKDKWALNQISSGKKIIFTVPNYDSESHVRYFDSMEDVRKRYEKIIQIDWIETKAIANSDSRIFIAEGIKK
jgi:SAM-dependent methyltransferase